MVRPLRLEFPGALYHVISRGNERAPIFRDDWDRGFFLGILGSVIRDNGWLLHSYCLLGNHYHLLLETPQGNLSKGMHALNGRYTQKFNRRHARAGHVLEGRFKAIFVEKEPHLLELHRYIVLNPVRAGLVARPEDWTWSSYRATCGLRNRPQWLEVRWTLAQFAGDVKTAVRSYARFVASGIDEADPPNARAQIFLGGQSFVATIASRLGRRTLDREIPTIQREPCRPSLDLVCTVVTNQWNLPRGALDRRRAGEARVAAIYIATKVCGLTAREVGAAFGIKRGRVSNIVAKVERDRDEDLRNRIVALTEALRSEMFSNVLSRLELKPKW
jgi:putative transposase